MKQENTIDHVGKKLKNKGIFKNILVTYVKPTNKETAFEMGLSLAKTNNSQITIVGNIIDTKKASQD